MRWDRLFADLEGQFEEARRAEFEAEVADRIRRERASIGLMDRLRANVGRSLRIQLLGDSSVTGSVSLVGTDWLLLESDLGGDVVVPIAAVAGVRGLDHRAVTPGSEGIVASRLSLGYVLRAIARDRAALLVTLIDRQVLGGTIDRVGADSFDLAEHPPTEPRRPTAVRAIVTIPFRAVANLLQA